MKSLLTRWLLVLAIAIPLTGSTPDKAASAGFPITFHGCAEQICWDWAGMKVKRVIPSEKIRSVQVFHAASLSREKRQRIETILREFAKGEGQFSPGLHMAMVDVDNWEAVILTVEGKVFLLSEWGIPPALLVSSEGKSGVVPLTR